MQKAVINTEIATCLIKEQFPKWGHLKLEPIKREGGDNYLFRLGKDFVLRFPTSVLHKNQVEKEQNWLPKLAPFLPITIPSPVAKGKPGHGYPWHWSIYKWIPGTPLYQSKSVDNRLLAKDFSDFILDLHKIDTTGAPLAGKDTFYRGEPLSVYTPQIKQAFDLLEKQKIDPSILYKIWKKGLESEWPYAFVWVHGDLSPGNLLLKNGKLHAVIDFGQACVGDPACDLVLAWTYFDEPAKSIFMNNLPHIDLRTWDRSRAWALWKASIIASGLCQSNEVEKHLSSRVLTEALKENR